MVKQYLKHSRDILSSEGSRFKFNERRGLGRIYLFGYQNRYDLNEGFPLLTTKSLGFKSIAHELIWFLRGDTNIKYLADNNVNIWNKDAFNFNFKGMVQAGVFSNACEKDSEDWNKAMKEYVQRVKEDSSFAERWGDLGDTYGKQWRKFGPERVDQIEKVIKGIKKDPTSARHMVVAWNPSEVENVALPPCHALFHLNSDGESLDLQLYQRACDMFLGVPFNIASYSLLTMILAKETGLKQGEFIHTFGDVHFYTGAGERGRWYRDNFGEVKNRIADVNSQDGYLEVLDWINKSVPLEDKAKEGQDHVTGILEQLSRTPRALPRVRIADRPFDKLTIDDFVLEGYDPHPPIKRALAV